MSERKRIINEIRTQQRIALRGLDVEVPLSTTMIGAAVLTPLLFVVQFVQ